MTTTTHTEKVTVTEEPAMGGQRRSSVRVEEEPRRGKGAIIGISMVVGVIIGVVATNYIKTSPVPTSLPLSIVDRTALANELATAVKITFGDALKPLGDQVGAAKSSVDNLALSSANRRTFVCGPESAPNRRIGVVLFKASPTSDLSLANTTSVCAGLTR